MIQEMADALLTTYWHSESTKGGRGKGCTMRNAAGVTFNRTDYKADPGDSEKDESDLTESELYLHPTARSKVMAWYLQGLEAAFCHTLTKIQGKYDYTVVGNEHDGLITEGHIPKAAIREARELSGFSRAEFEPKDFADAKDFERQLGPG